MSLSVTVLGCAGSYPGPGDACSGYLVRSPHAVTVLDLGPGALANLQQHVELAQVNAVVLTHEHPDHWLDLPILRNAMRYYLGLEGLPVYSTAGGLEAARAVFGDPEPTFHWTVVDASSEVRVGDQHVRFAQTDHPVETLAVRVEAGESVEAGETRDSSGAFSPRSGSAAGAADGRRRSLVYSADTGPGWWAGDLGRDADLFVCEATVPVDLESDSMPHLSGRQAGERARAAGAAHLVVTHIAPGVDQQTQRQDAAEAFGGPVELARNHATFTL
jgi:ribonuclease BN (tRNA processing enzyme)